jgi:putative DNA primase/helicase
MPHLDSEAIRFAARGLWPSILASLGIHADHLKNRHGTCPGCGGRDRFRFDDKDGRGTFFCNARSPEPAGDGFALVMHAKGIGFTEALRMVADVLGRGLPAMASTPRREVDDTQRREKARQRAAQLWNEAQPYLSHKPFKAHPYLLRKGITSHGVRVRNGLLVIPARDAEGELHSLQFIAGDGAKRMMAGGRVRGCYHAIGKVGDTLCIAEGFATAASVYEATGHATACAFSANNLKPVALALRAKFPEVRIMICADDDEAGLKAAQEAAAAVGGFIVRPEVLA